MPKKPSILTQEKNLARASKEIGRIKADGFTVRQQARAQYGRATKHNMGKVKYVRSKIAKGKPLDTATSRQIGQARRKLEAKADKKVLSQKRLAHEAKTTGLKSVDIAQQTKQDAKEVYQALKRAKKGELSQTEYRTLKAGLEKAQEKNVYSIHDDSGQFPDCPVFPNKTQARGAGAKESIKQFMDEGQAYEWWKTIAAGAGYFVIVHNKDTFEIWDTRTKAEHKARKR
jgi:hypothetical protein